jgi:hypothetical protein
MFAESLINRWASMSFVAFVCVILDAPLKRAYEAPVKVDWTEC